jgi:hypothetical protein
MVCRKILKLCRQSSLIENLMWTKFELKNFLAPGVVPSLVEMGKNSITHLLTKRQWVIFIDLSLYDVTHAIGNSFFYYIYILCVRKQTFSSIDYIIYWQNNKKNSMWLSGWVTAIFSILNIVENYVCHWVNARKTLKRKTKGKIPDRQKGKDKQIGKRKIFLVPRPSSSDKFIVLTETDILVTHTTRKPNCGGFWSVRYLSLFFLYVFFSCSMY